MLHPVFFDLALRLRAFNAQSDYARLVQSLSDTTIFVWDLLKIQHVGIEVPNLNNVTAVVERLRRETAVLVNSEPVLVAFDLRMVLPFLTSIFDIDANYLGSINPYSPDCLDALRQVLLGLLARHEQVELYARTFELVGQRSGALSTQMFGNGFVQLGVVPDSTVQSLKGLLARWNIGSFVTETHGDGRVLMF